ncbi:hypothetical protein [Isoptericola aurantiacus]|uniref:hypothetical protein n=1 Tax=Isoptericola aurantiacus TaxID=3377839 RepID=UPI00383A8BA7
MTADGLALVPPLSVDEFKNAINLTDENQTDEAEQWLRAAVRTVEGRVGALNPRSITVQLDEGHGGRYWHRTDPVLEVTAVDGETPTAVRVSSIGVITGLPTSAAAITLRIGQEPVPDDLVLAVFFLGSHLWEMRRGRQGRRGAYARDDEPAPQTGFAIPRRALELMADHLLPGMA